MDTKLIDVFVSYSRADSVRVEPWVLALRRGGVTVWYDTSKDNGPSKRQTTVEGAVGNCEVLIFFVSKVSKESAEAGRMAGEASGKGRAVIIVALDASAVPAVFDVTLPGVTVVNTVVIGRQAAWEGILKAVRSHGVPWIVPGSRRKRSSRPNEYRGARLARGFLRTALVIALLLVGGSLAITRFKHPAVGPAAALPTTPAPMAVTETKPLLTVTTDVPPARREPLPEKPAVTQQDLADPLTLRAIEHVRRCIEAATREHGLTSEQIDVIASYWADPTFIEGKGLQDAAAMKASMTARQRELPRWKEMVHFIKAVGTDKPTVLEVIAQTIVSATNADHVESRATVLAHYWVDMSVADQPKITKLWPEQVKEL
ncbi:MAG: hypothetical protein JWO94_2683 [Verrucomicrobiaceae bacterium]|nr:hypothetical protein [Verrucomicrobiaceae bacterium]